MDGRACRGLVEALSVKEAREKLSTDGILAERVSATGKQVRFPLEARAVVYRELAALLKAGVPLSRALQILIASPQVGAVSQLLASVRDRIREGASLADSLRDASASVSAYEYSVLLAGERAATVDEILVRLADHLEEEEKFKERVRSALIYPCIVVAMGLAVAIVMLGVLVPRTQKMLLDSGQPLPGLTEFTIALGSATLHWGPVALIALLLAGGLLYWRLVRNADFRRRWDRALFRIPVWGRGYALLTCVRFSRTLSVLLNGGVQLIEGLRLAGKATGSSSLSWEVDQQADAVQHGAKLSDAISKVGPLAESLPGWIQIGEESGNLAELMEHAGTRYAERWERFIGRALALLEPVLILAIGVFVLFITLAVLLPVISLTQTIG
jgi:general secretion pathway protein F